jgi:hypothetical protein
MTFVVKKFASIRAIRVRVFSWVLFESAALALLESQHFRVLAFQANPTIHFSSAVKIITVFSLHFVLREATLDGSLTSACAKAAARQVRVGWSCSVQMLGKIKGG